MNGCVCLVRVCESVLCCVLCVCFVCVNVRRLKSDERTAIG